MTTKMEGRHSKPNQLEASYFFRYMTSIPQTRPRTERRKSSHNKFTTITNTTTQPHPSFAYPSKPFPFLSLPLELRLRIYSFLPHRTPTNSHAHVYSGPVFSPTLLLINRALYAEILPELYRLATLRLRIDYLPNYMRDEVFPPSESPFWPAVRFTTRTRASFVGHLDLRVWDLGNFPICWTRRRIDAFTASLGRMPRLRVLTLRTTDSLWLRKGDRLVRFAADVFGEIGKTGRFEMVVVVAEKGASGSVEGLREAGFTVVHEGRRDSVVDSVDPEPEGLEDMRDLERSLEGLEVMGRIESPKD